MPLFPRKQLTLALSTPRQPRLRQRLLLLLLSFFKHFEQWLQIQCLPKYSGAAVDPQGIYFDFVGRCRCVVVLVLRGMGGGRLGRVVPFLPTRTPFWLGLNPERRRCVSATDVRRRHLQTELDPSPTPAYLAGLAGCS